ncbi:hypothetical protein ES703_14036 [subsurface metagenome]
MLRQGIIGTIQEFRLYDPRKTNQLPGGFMFARAAEYLPDLGGWVAQCHACGCLRALVIDNKKQIWQCNKCNRAGMFKKIEAMKKEQKKNIKIRKRGRKEKRENENRKTIPR